MKVLIVVDMQNDFIYGSLGSFCAKSIVKNVVSKIREAKEKDWYVIATMDTHREDDTDTVESQMLGIKHCIRGTKGFELNENVFNELRSLKVNRSDICSKSTFLLKNIDSYIWKASDKFFEENKKNWYVEEIEIVGLCTSVCVISTVLYLRSMFPCVKIVVDAACCADSAQDAHDNAISVMANCCIEIKNLGSEPWRTK